MPRSPIAPTTHATNICRGPSSSIDLAGPISTGSTRPLWICRLTRLPIDAPVRRYQNEFGINYYFYQRMELKCAYQINTEPGNSLHDNQFMTELAWGW